MQSTKSDLVFRYAAILSSREMEKARRCGTYFLLLVSLLAIYRCEMVLANQNEVSKMQRCPEISKQSAAMIEFETAAGVKFRIPSSVKPIDLSPGRDSCRVASADFWFHWNGTDLKPLAEEQSPFTQVRVALLFGRGIPKSQRSEGGHDPLIGTIRLPYPGLSFSNHWGRSKAVPTLQSDRIDRSNSAFVVEGVSDRRRDRSASFRCHLPVGYRTVADVVSKTIPEETYCRSTWGFIPEADAYIYFKGKIMSDAQWMFSALENTLQSYIVKD